MPLSQQQQDTQDTIQGFSPSTGLIDSQVADRLGLGGSGFDPLGLFNQGFTAPAELDPTQLRNQNNLVQMFMSLINQSQGGFNQLPGAGQNLAGQGQGLVNQLGQSGAGLQPFTEQDQFLGQQLQGATGVVQDFLNKNLNEITGVGNVQGGGAFHGGGRESVLQGAAIGEAGVGLGAIFSDIFAGDIQRRQDAAGQQGQQQIAGQLGGLQGLGSIFDLFQGGLLGQFGGLNQLQGLLGPPTAVGGGGAGGGAFGSGGGGGLGGIVGGLLSDERLKENIFQVGVTEAGQPYYIFNYIGNPAVYLGVLAQESPPEAVSIHASGYMMVDYGMIH